MKGSYEVVVRNSRVQFKLKYEGLLVKKSIVPIRPESAAKTQDPPPPRPEPQRVSPVPVRWNADGSAEREGD